MLFVSAPTDQKNYRHGHSLLFRREQTRVSVTEIYGLEASMVNNKEKRYLLDLNVILSIPDILSRADASKRFMIPEVILEQVSKLRVETSSQLYTVLNAAIMSGVGVLCTMTHVSLPVDITLSSVDYIDRQILKAIIGARATPYNDITLVTNDRALHRAAIKLGIEVINSETLLETMRLQDGDESAHVNQEIAGEISKFAKAERAGLRRTLVVAGIGLAVGLVMGNQGDRIVAFLASIPGFIVGMLALISGMILFALRQRYRTSYGALEVVAGACIAATAFPLNTGIDFTAGLQVLGGLYVIVRGLDNLGGGITGTRYAAYWPSIFR